MKDNLKEVLLAVFISIIFFLLMALVLRKPSPVEEEDLASRTIDIVESGDIEGSLHYRIVADRETDVEYLVVYTTSGGVGVSIMRDGGGVVKHREQEDKYDFRI